MRVNKFIAQASGLSRRAADNAVIEGRVQINGQPADSGQSVSDKDIVMLDGHRLTVLEPLTVITLNKPVGFVCSRQGQGSKTIYELLPKSLHHLKPVGRLDKDSSGLLLLTNDGELAYQLTHPRFQKLKEYEIVLGKSLEGADRDAIEQGFQLEDGLSRLVLRGGGKNWSVTMQEGRNRQIRRTFAALGYEVTKLHRTNFGPYSLGAIKVGEYRTVPQG